MSTVFFSDITTGIVEYCVTHSLNDFKQGEIYEGKLAVLSDLEPSTTVGNYYLSNGNILVILPPKPSNYHIWNLQTEQWQEPEGYLQTIQTENTTQINQLASQKILPKYPIYLQLNLPYDFGQDSVEVQTMRTWIDNVRTLANTAKAEIALATTLEEITTIVDNFKQELAEIS